MDYTFVPGTNRQQFHHRQSNINQNCRGRQGQSFQAQFGNVGRSPQPFNSGFPVPLRTHNHNSTSTVSNQFNFPLRSTRTFPNSNTNNHKPPRRQSNHQQQTTENISRSDSPHNTNKSEHNKSVGHSNETVATGGNMAQPQYRIFKRGDTIPGISSPISLGAASIQNTESLGASTLSNEVLHKEDKFGAVTENINLDGFTKDPVLSSSEPLAVNGSSGYTHEDPEPVTNVRNQQRGQVNRTSLSLVADLARFHGVAAEYRLTNETGPPHAPTFTIVLILGNEQYQAQGPSIKKAQLAAAAIALEQTNLSTPPPRAQPRKSFQQGGKSNQRRSNWTLMQLNALAEELGETITFASQAVPVLNQYNRTETQTIVAIHVGDSVFTGEGSNLNTAKNNAALVALKGLIQLKKGRETAKLLEDGEIIEEPESLDTEIKSPISIVHEMALKRGLKVSFDIVGEQGPPHMKVFTIKCSVGALETNGEGSTKQQAKKASCEAMIVKLKEIPLKQPKATTLKSIQNGLKVKTKVARKKPSTPVIKVVDKQVVSPISRLLQIAHIRKYKEPEFALVKQNDGTETVGNGNGKGPDRRNRKKKPFFTMQVTVGPHVCEGSGSNKKSAKKAAADSALVLLGYAPTETKENDCVTEGKDHTTEEAPTISLLSSVGTASDTNKKIFDSKITSARQIVPGVLVLKSGATSQTSSSPSTSPAVAAQEMVKVNAMVQQPAQYKPLDGIGKLAYLAELLGICVSYSDFPKKNEFLSVASLGTNPPHVAHGIGPTREEAQNSAAVQILEELSSSDLDNVSSSSSLSGSIGGAVHSETILRRYV
ncbi:unnamed protein product [Allacma fusca]|uniref:DRBM domain-containing protein n=1 Tax=Allacma fusca TaxID=39272 RepID=A0A8J2J7V1_9HEXA|nr:unnamed protein product [Allacma fusca]